MSYASEVLADSPVAWYRMQEASGLIQDSSGNGNHATSGLGGAGYSEASPILSDPGDAAINFDGSDDFRVPDHSSLDVGDVFTVEVWVKRNSTGTHLIASKAGLGAWSLAFISEISTLYEPGDGSIVTGSTAISDTNTWHHIVATCDGSTRFMYLDGVDDTDTGASEPGAPSNNASELTIGSEGGSFLLNARLDELALYPTALSAARVLAHYEAAAGDPLGAAFYQSDRLRKFLRGPA